MILSDAKPPHRSNRDLGEDVTRAHPLLIHEFGPRTKSGRLYVLHPGFLASALEYAARKLGRPSTVDRWLAASHRSDFLPRLASTGLRAEPTPSSSGQPAVPDPSATEPRREAAAQAAFTAPTLTEVMNLSSPQEFVQYNEAIPRDFAAIQRSWEDLVVAGTWTGVRLGRLLADLALAGRVEIATQMASVVERLAPALTPDVANAVVLGMVLPAFFDRYGELLRRPAINLGPAVLALDGDPRWRPAFAAVSDYLRSGGAELPYMPGSPRRAVRYSLDLIEGTGNAPRVIRGLRIGEQSALADPLPSGSNRSFSTLFGRSTGGVNVRARSCARS